MTTMAMNRFVTELPGIGQWEEGLPAKSLITPNHGSSPWALPTTHPISTGWTGTHGGTPGLGENELQVDGPPTGGAESPGLPGPGVSSGPGLLSPLVM